jgi:hypothetical protein
MRTYDDADRRWQDGSESRLTLSEAALAARARGRTRSVVAVQLLRVVRGMSRLRRAGVLAIAMLASAPLAAAAAPEHGSTVARAAAAAGVSYGGLTSQDFPVVVEVNRTGRKVVRADIAIRLTCTAGGFTIGPDSFGRLSVRKTGKFGSSFGPETRRNDDGTTTDFEGMVSGAFNSRRTKVAGKWSFKATEHDVSGAITDTCDSGSVSWSAKQ